MAWWWVMVPPASRMAWLAAVLTGATVRAGRGLGRDEGVVERGAVRVDVGDVAHDDRATPVDLERTPDRVPTACRCERLAQVVAVSSVFDEEPVGHQLIPQIAPRTGRAPTPARPAWAAVDPALPEQSVRSALPVPELALGPLPDEDEEGGPVQPPSLDVSEQAPAGGPGQGEVDAGRPRPTAGRWSAVRSGRTRASARAGPSPPPRRTGKTHAACRFRRRQRCDPQRGLGDDAERALTPTTTSSRRGRRPRPSASAEDELTARRGQPQPDHVVVDPAVPGGGLAADRRDVAADRRLLMTLGVCPRVRPGVQRSLCLRPAEARAQGGGPADGSTATSSSRRRSSEITAVKRSESVPAPTPPTTLVPPPNGTTATRCSAHRQHGRDLASTTRHDHAVRGVGPVTGAQPVQVRIALAAGVLDAPVPFQMNVIRPDHIGQRLSSRSPSARVTQPRRRQRNVLQRTGGGLPRADPTQTELGPEEPPRRAAQRMSSRRVPPAVPHGSRDHLGERT